MDAGSDTMTRRMWRRSRCAATLLRLPVLLVSSSHRSRNSSLASNCSSSKSSTFQRRRSRVRSPFFVAVWEAIVEAIHLLPEEQVFQSIREQIVYGTKRVVEQTVVPRSTPQERVQNRSFVRQSTEETGDGVQHVPSKRMQEAHKGKKKKRGDPTRRRKRKEVTPQGEEKEKR